ncbi:uncharacterized protein LOC131645266 [Vicia villosa]|uniref:uncharacterized protein LOC131645266 n=1 Tax=Vicia villosa TaxID=3911 RepID=UPI00273CE9B3|nr:uncharacterized protein LOC131645266 [Vicia villosa]
MPRAHHQNTWQPPHPGWLKCNVDAGFNTSLGTTNGGWCVRDSGGRFMVAGTLWNRGNVSIVEAEAIALKEVIQGAINLHLQHIIFESDSQIVVQATKDPSLGNSEFSLIINSIRNLLSSRNDFEVKFVKRQANCVAHSLAKAANFWSRRAVLYWIPQCIEQFLINDMN